MVIGILFSEPGAGKTKGALTFEEPITAFDMENRMQKKIDAMFPEKLINVLQLKKYDKDYNEDKISSFIAFVQEVDKLIHLKPDDFPRTVIIDGIGDLRDYAHEKWCKDKGRKQAVNPGDWEQINDMVRDSLFPLINWARVNNITLIMTSQMKDSYTVVDRDGKKESAREGRVPSHKEWCSYNVDFLVELWQPKGKDGKIIPGQYFATCSKSEVGSWSEDITGRNLYEIFLEKGMM
jgi:hypothetical protein